MTERVFHAHPFSYSVKDAAVAMGISSSLLERIIAQGDINVQWIEGKRVIDTDEIRAYVKSRPFAKEGAAS